MFLWLNQLIIIDHHAGQSVETSIRYSCSDSPDALMVNLAAKKYFSESFWPENETEIKLKYFLSDVDPRPTVMGALQASTHDITPYTKRYCTERLSIIHTSSIGHVSSQQITIKTLETRWFPLVRRSGYGEREMNKTKLWRISAKPNFRTHVMIESKTVHQCSVSSSPPEASEAPITCTRGTNTMNRFTPSVPKQVQMILLDSFRTFSDSMFSTVGNSIDKKQYF